jgi:hypothetical protein
MKYKKTIILSAFFSLLAATGVAGIFGIAGLRAPIALADDTCTITAADINQITAIQNDSTLTYSEELSQELSLRKKLVGQTIGCAQQEVLTLQADLQTTSTDPNVLALQSQFLGSLNDASNFYNIEQTKLNGAGIAGTETVAKEVLAWRQNTFMPLGENINNYLLWAQNQGLFDTAEERMDQTQRAVTFLESATPNADLQTALDQAMASFTDAQNQNAAAKAALSQGLSPDQSLALIKQSLDSLSSTYQDFFTVSTLIKGILPS